MTDIWFHWSPTDRRARIIKRGLVPGQWSIYRQWKPPYICLANRPSLAWGLSGAMDRGGFHPEWDLWQVRVHEQSGYEELYFDGNRGIKEIRVYERIYKRNIWYVGSRVR